MYYTNESDDKSKENILKMNDKIAAEKIEEIEKEVAR